MRTFVSDELETVPLSPENIVVGHIGTVWQALAKPGVPEACACLRRDLDVRHRFVLGYGGRCVTLGARAVGALAGLDRLKFKRRGGFDRLLG